MTTIAVYLWAGGRAYAPEHVNALQRQAARHLPGCRFVCVTDLPAKGFSADVEVVPPPEGDWKLLRSLRTMEGPRFPSCYPRMLTFSPWAECLGEKVLVLDIDCMVVGSLIDLVARDEAFVGWCPGSRWGRYPRLGGGTWLHRPGTLTDVWKRFIAHPKNAIWSAFQAGYRGSDQGLLSYWFVRTHPHWTTGDGIYQSQDGVAGWSELPANARIIHLNGDREKPWTLKRKWAYEALHGG